MAGLVLVDLSLIDVDPNNPRGEIDDVSDLAHSIAQRGQQEPLQVIPKRNGRYRLHEGHRRRKALLELGETHAKAIERTFRSELDELLAQGTIHAHRRDFNPMAWSRYVRRLWDHGMNRDQIAHQLGLSPNWVRDHLSFVHLTTDEQRQLEAGTLSRKEALLRLAARRAVQQGRPAPHTTTRAAAPVIPGQRRSSESHFSAGHRLAEQAAARCASGGLEHVASPKIGGVACGKCWEDVIRADALTAVRPSLVTAA